MSPARATPSASRRPLILIVDDMPDIRDMHAEYLAGEIRRVLRGWRRSH